MLVEDHRSHDSQDDHRPEVNGDLPEDLADEGELVCEGHVEVFLNHVSIMEEVVGKLQTYRAMMIAAKNNSPRRTKSERWINRERTARTVRVT